MIEIKFIFMIVFLMIHGSVFSSNSFRGGDTSCICVDCVHCNSQEKSEYIAWCGYCSCCINVDEKGAVLSESNSSVSHDNFNHQKLDITSLAQNILNDVLSFNLKTTNSLASDRCDRDSLRKIRRQFIVNTYYDGHGGEYYCLDEMYNLAESSIKHGVANCQEYSVIAAILTMEKCYDFTSQIMLKYISGTNFDHDFIVIGSLHADESQWVAIDPWMRIVFPFSETVKYLQQAGVYPTTGSRYRFKIMAIHDRANSYYPMAYNLRTVEKCATVSPKSVMVSFDESGYKVPYESKQKCYYPETGVITFPLANMRLTVKHKQ
jgi:hypothetical protein